MLQVVLTGAAGYHTAAYHILPWSITDLKFGDHFRLTAKRLETSLPVIRENGLRVGLEFIGSFGLRRTQKYDFLHTVEGVRSLIAAAGAEESVGLKLDSYHWWCTGALLESIVKLEAHEVVYVELNDAWAGFSRAATPELSRDLPGRQGVIDSAALLAVLRHIGYEGPVVAEPFNRPLQSLDADGAVAAASEALDLTFASALRRMLPEELVGDHAYHAEVLAPAASRSTEVPQGRGYELTPEAFDQRAHESWHRINSRALPRSL